jgi:hypothetical protein
MGTEKKRRRRAENRIFQDYLVAFDGTRRPLKHTPAAMEMLREFARPLRSLIEEEQTRYSIAIFAWNLSLMPPERHEELIAEFLDPIVPRDSTSRTPLIGLIHAMIERRRTHYAREDVAFLPIGEAAGDAG